MMLFYLHFFPIIGDLNISCQEKSAFIPGKKLMILASDSYWRLPYQSCKKRKWSLHRRRARSL